MRLEELEHEVFKYKKMVERRVEMNHHIILEIYDLQNQNCEYEFRFNRMSFGANFRTLETTSSVVDGKPLPWKFDDQEEEEEGSSKNQD